MKPKRLTKEEKENEKYLKHLLSFVKKQKQKAKNDKSIKGFYQMIQDDLQEELNYYG